MRQLILAAGEEKACFVIADTQPREDTEAAIRENVDVPKNVRIVCRSADITDPASLEKLSIHTCRSVIISPYNDSVTVRAALAAAALDAGVPINAMLYGDGYQFPPTAAQRNRISALHTNDILARIIAHSCTQTGLSTAFREVFDFEGSELYLAQVPEAAGLSFAEVTERLDRAVPVGLRRDGRIMINPPAQTVIAEGEQLLVFSEERNCAVLTPAREGVLPASFTPVCAPTEDVCVILGSNPTLSVILRELPENIARVCLAGGEADAAGIEAAAERGLQLETVDADPSTETGLRAVAAMAEHIVILNDHEKDERDADLEAMFLLLRLRDLRERFGLRFNVTTELRMEADQALAADGDHTDFVVTTSLSAMFLARLAENPELIDVFREILSNEGNELYLRDADALGMCGEHSVRTLRAMALRHGHVLLGFMDARHESTFNPPLDAVFSLTEADQVIVLGEV